MGLSRDCNIASARVVGLVAVVRLDRVCWFCRVWLQQENAHVGGARDSKLPCAPFLLSGFAVPNPCQARARARVRLGTGAWARRLGIFAGYERLEAVNDLPGRNCKL